MSFNINRYIILRFLWFDGKQQQCKNKKSLFLSMIETMLYYYKSYLIQQRKTSKVINMQWEVNGGKLYNKIQYILKSLRSRFMCITYSCIFFESYIHCKKLTLCLKNTKHWLASFYFIKTRKIGVIYRSKFSISKIYNLSLLEICRIWKSLNTVLWIPPFQQWQENRIWLYRLACFCVYLTKLKILAVLLFGLCHCLCLYTKRYEAKRGWDRMSPFT